VKISVVTVAYNAAGTISKTLASVAAQNHPEVEHIVVDGNSTDETAAIVASQAPGARLVIEPDEGIYDAMNKGISLATGDVIAILNADDHYCHPDVLGRVAGAFAEGDLDAVFSDIGFFRPETPRRIFRRYRSTDFKPSGLRFGLMPAHPGMFLRRSVYENFGLYDKSYRIASDFEFVARIFSRGGIRYANLGEVAVLMQTGGASTRNLRSTLTIFRECVRACRENGIATSPFRMLGKYPAKLPQYFGSWRQPLSAYKVETEHGRFENMS
jgi:glycosyltransferase involved in cell wall biosynthesis